ncbi:MAG TPA: hypothetical protein VFS47_13230 [Steroidobacteraceae bacterium]|nr:hypothetical protein [Steroidobacteraceae bacterium]
MFKSAWGNARVRGMLAIIVVVAALASMILMYLGWGADSLVHPRARDSMRSRWYSDEVLGGDSPASLLNAAFRSEAAVGQSGNLIDFRPASGSETLRLVPIGKTLGNSEAWERGDGPEPGSVGYPAVVQNARGASADGKFYLYYAIHDPPSGIAVAIADRPEGPYRKLADLTWTRSDSRVLRAPPLPRETSHFSSPVVIWNEQEQKWFMYFHYYSNEWERNRGHQRTALAVTEDLATHRWEIWRDDRGDIISVMPTTPERWMNSQSTYHAIARLPNSLWVAFLRGVGGTYEDGKWKQDPAMLGFAFSRDGRRWTQLANNPVLPAPERRGKTGVLRPLLFGLYRDRLLLCWGESAYYDSNPKARCGTTTDFVTINDIPHPIADIDVQDGPASVLQTSGRMLLFDGDMLYELVRPRARN